MDTSATYIKMRLKAIADLGRGQPPEMMPDDYCSFQSANIFIDGKGNWYYSSQYQAVQLERQDQLQEMVKETNQLLSDGEWAYRFGQWCFLQLPRIVFASMEQLWLAFVMKEKYNKVWSGEDWVNAIY